MSKEERQAAIARAIREWVKDAVIPRHEGCQGEGDYELTFSQSPEEFAKELCLECFQVCGPRCLQKG